MPCCVADLSLTGITWKALSSKFDLCDCHKLYLCTSYKIERNRACCLSPTLSTWLLQPKKKMKKNNCKAKLDICDNFDQQLTQPALLCTMHALWIFCTNRACRQQQHVAEGLANHGTCRLLCRTVSVVSCPLTTTCLTGMIPVAVSCAPPACMMTSRLTPLLSKLFQVQVEAEHKALLLNCILKLKDMVQSIYT